MVKKVAFLFPGQGSQSVGMGQAFAGSSQKAKSVFEQADQILGYSLSQIMFTGPEDKLRETTITQPALFVASAAALELLKERNINPNWVAGHSLGEYSALYAAGALSFETALNLVQQRGQAMQEAGRTHPGTMAAVIGLAYETLETICRDVSTNGQVCVSANFNTESQIVISGHKDAVTLAAEKAKQAGALKVVMLNVSGAFHSPLMTSAVEILKPIFEKSNFSNTTIPVLTNVDAEPTVEANQFKAKLLAQIDHSVLWHATLKNLIQLGTEIFIEVGSGKVLSTMAKKLDRQKNSFCTDEIDLLDKHLSTASSI